MNIWVKGDEDTNTVFGGKQQRNAFMYQPYSRSGNYIIPSCPQEYFHIQQTCTDLDFQNGSAASARASTVFGFLCQPSANASSWGSLGDKVLGREGGRRVKRGRLKGRKPSHNASGCRGRQPGMLKRTRHHEFTLCFCSLLLLSPRTLPCTVLSSSCTEQHVNCCFTRPANISKLQRSQRAGPQPRPGVCGQMECELRVREKRGSNNEASPLCWLFVWTDRLSHSTSCGWNTNGYD